MLAEDLGDAHVGDAEAELERLTLNPSVAPARVLAGKSEDQLPKLGINRLASA